MNGLLKRASRDVLPPPLRVVLAAIGERLERQWPIEPQLAIKLSELHRLAPETIVRAEREIIEAAQLFHRRRTNSLMARIIRLFVSRPTELQQLSQVDGLEYVLLFHRNGHIREAALRKITGALPSFFAFAAVSWRLNDWSPPVREAAADCASQSFAKTAAPIMAQTALSLLTRQYSWSRWANEKAIFEAALNRADVSAALADLIIYRRTGPTATTLRFALKGDGLDSHLPRIARMATQPEVRAFAAKTLIDGYASWPNGWQWRWIDKSMGLRVREPAFARREVKTSVAREAIIAACAVDKAAVMRRVAVASLIRYSPGSAQALSLAKSLEHDSSRSVRERAEFILRGQRQPQT